MSCLHGVHAVTHHHVQKQTQHLQQLQEHSEEMPNLSPAIQHQERISREQGARYFTAVHLPEIRL